MKFSVTSLALAIGLVAATSKTRTISFLDKFDDRKVIIAAAGSNAVGNYGALNYKSFSLAGGPVNLGFSISSSPNFIFNGPTTQLVNGQPQLLLPNSTVKSFTLKSAAYACSGQTNNIPVSCTLQFAAKDLYGVTSIKNVVYNPGLNVIKAPFAKTTFPQKGFSNLKEVSIAIVQSAMGQVVTQSALDNVGYDAVMVGR